MAAALGSAATTAPGTRVAITGGRSLRGAYRVPGAKNAVLPMMAACLLTEETCVIEDVPLITDIMVMAELLRGMGARVELDTERRSVAITAASVHSTRPDPRLVRAMRASFQVTGPLLSRFGRVDCHAPGGCQLGTRPVNVDIEGFEVMGASIAFGGGVYHAEADPLVGGRVYLDYPSHTGTQNLLMAATLASGYTTIVHASREPEVIALVHFLRSMGAEIHGEGTSTIGVQGQQRLYGTVARAIPDRIVGSTMAVAAAITGGDVELLNVRPEHLQPVLVKLAAMGVTLHETNRSVRVMGSPMLSATAIQCIPFPGFPTDVQATMGTLMTQAHGVSSIIERVYDGNLGYVEQLQRMGADVVVDGPTARIRGPTPLTACEMRLWPDIRAGAALLLAGLVARGTTVLDNVEVIQRGYQDLPGELRELGADIAVEPRPRPAAAPAAAG